MGIETVDIKSTVQFDCHINAKSAHTRHASSNQILSVVRGLISGGITKIYLLEISMNLVQNVQLDEC